MAGICGVMRLDGAIDLESGISYEVYALLYGLQNRGQASAKIITQMKNPSENVYFYNGNIKYTPLSNIMADNLLYCEKKGDGAVREVFNNKVLLDLYGESGIGGVSNKESEESESLPYRFKMIVVGKDGWIENHQEIKEFLKNKKVPFKTETTEVEAYAKLFHYHYRRTNNGKDAMKLCAVGTDEAPKVKGSYSAIALTPKSIVCVGNGKPLGYLILKDRVYIASESAGPWSMAKEVNANNFNDYWKDLKPGEIIELYRDEINPQTGLSSYVYDETSLKQKRYDYFQTDKRICSFEWAYFARPDSVIFGKEAGWVRKEIARLCAPTIMERVIKSGGTIENCIIAPVLESGNWYGVGMAEASKIPFIPALYKNKYALKSFILDYQENRDREVQLKHIPSVTLLKDKDVILMDDSIVRGTTMRVIVDLVREKGKPKRVHVCAGFPEKRYACIYGKESRGTLIAQELPLDEIRKKIHADSLTYGTDAMWKQVLGEEFCFACETGKI